MSGEEIVHDLHEEEMHVEESAGHGDESAFEIMTDPAHMAAELSYEAFFLLAGAIINSVVVGRKLKRRDRKHGHAHATA